MLYGRETELSYLKQLYEKDGSQLFILYGQKYIGKTSFVKEVLKLYSGFYYQAKSCSEKMQMQFWNHELSEHAVAEEELSFSTLLENSIQEEQKKSIIVIDEFQLLLKTSRKFSNDLNVFLTKLKKQKNGKEVLLILTSSSIAWVENTMVSKLGKTAFQISGLYKLKELSFQNMMELFPDYSVKDCITVFGITGGVPGILLSMHADKSIRDNIIALFGESNSFGRVYGETMLLEELRETNVYHTILQTLAMGKNKLNDIYEETSFSRAKISVYLKNLIELELVEKVFSLDTAGRENSQKGIYRIKNKFVSFWFTYIFPYSARMTDDNQDTFYETIIKPSINTYLAETFRDVCVACMETVLQKNQITLSIDRVGEWIGKSGNIDIIIEEEHGKTATCFCKCENAHVTYEDYEWNLFTIENAKIEPDYIILFSLKGFDEQLILESRTKKNVILVSLDELF